jgi:hypothetical protein
MSETSPLVCKTSKRKEVCRAYYERHCEKLKAKSSEYYHSNKERYQNRYFANKEEMKAYNQEYRKTHREALNRAQREYRARKKERELNQASPIE